MSAHHRGLTNNQVLANYHAATEDVLYDVGMDKTHLSLLLREVSAGSLKVKHSKELLGADKVAQLTRENILTVNPSTRLVAFNSRTSKRSSLRQVRFCSSARAHEITVLF